MWFLTLVSLCLWFSWTAQFLVSLWVKWAECAGGNWFTTILTTTSDDKQSEKCSKNASLLTEYTTVYRIIKQSRQICSSLTRNNCKLWREKMRRRRRRCWWRKVSRVLKIVYISTAKTDRNIVGQDRRVKRLCLYEEECILARGVSNVSNWRKYL